VVIDEKNTPIMFPHMGAIGSNHGSSPQRWRRPDAVRKNKQTKK